MQLLVFLTAALGSVALAQQPTSSTVNFVCATRYALQPTNQIRTTTFRVSTTNTAGRTVTVTPRTTTTIGANTFTVTNTFTSRSTVTAASSVATATAYVTATSTLVSTVTQTFTTATVTTVTNSIAGVTSTVSAPAGFTALGLTPDFNVKRDALPEPRHPRMAKRAVAKGHLPILPEARNKKIQARQNSGQEFPVGVLCTSRTTFFATGTVTSTAAGPTQTITTSSGNVVRTVTTTITGAPTTITPAGTTRFITVTSTTLTSATTTSTTLLINTATVNLNAPASTAFAQCLPNNLITTTAFGNQIGTVTISSASSVVRSIDVTDFTGLECCTACARLATCAGFAQQSVVEGGRCYLIEKTTTTNGGGVCDATQTWGNAFHYYGVSGGRGYTVGNGQCGRLGSVAGPPGNGNS
ncbi:hypothetical protein BST61_g1427 [Cercospora zeina]